MVVPGNKSEYGSEHVITLKDTPLSGKNVLFLGSSVTFGACSMEDGIPEYFGKRFDCAFTKEAVSGTTLVDEDETSYISRLLNNVDVKSQYDLFICQLSTNDATQNKPLGCLTDSFSGESYDTKTITGAIEFIISYVKRTWNCPIMFYTGSRYDSLEYESMVNRLLEVAKKWDIGVIDLWTINDFNNIPYADRDLYMKDPIHPTKAGYMRWWCPEMEKQVIDYLNKRFTPILG